MGSSLSNVGVVDKTVTILEALEEGPCNLAELTGRTALPRATAHRLAVALEGHGLVTRTGDGRFSLGLRLVALGRAAGSQSHRSLAETAAPVLLRLRDRTGESAQLYVRAGGSRVCVAASESPHSLRTIVGIGAVLPMDRGSAAKVLAEDPPVIRRGWAESVEEREKGVASVSAPVRFAGVVVAALSVSGPLERTTRQPGSRYADAVAAAARELEVSLSATGSVSL